MYNIPFWTIFLIRIFIIFWFGLTVGRLSRWVPRVYEIVTCRHCCVRGLSISLITSSLFSLFTWSG